MDLGKTIFVITLGAACSMGLLRGHDYMTQRNNRQIQEGFVIPSKLEVISQDLDKNGKKETILTYDGKSYMFKLQDEIPTAQPYKIETTQK